MEALPPQLVAQIKLSIKLGYGFAFSTLGISGLGSLAAFVIGWQARRGIKRSGGQLAGLWLAWWCLLTGGLGTLAMLLTLLIEATKLRRGG